MEMVGGETMTRKQIANSVAFGISWLSPISGKIRPHE
jgi:hypothetical protein